MKCYEYGVYYGEMFGIGFTWRLKHSEFGYTNIYLTYFLQFDDSLWGDFILVTHYRVYGGEIRDTFISVRRAIGEPPMWDAAIDQRGIDRAFLRKMEWQLRGLTMAVYSDWLRQ